MKMNKAKTHEIKLEYKTPHDLFVKLIYGEDFDLPIRILCAEPERTRDILGLADAIGLIKNYNDFEGRKVAATLRKLHKKGVIETAIFGREFSPVLYIYPPYWTSQKSNASDEEKKRPRRFTIEERQQMFKTIISELQKNDPDELWAEDCLKKRIDIDNIEELYVECRVRAWWD